MSSKVKMIIFIPLLLLALASADDPYPNKLMVFHWIRNNGLTFDFPYDRIKPRFNIYDDTDRTFEIMGQDIADDLLMWRNSFKELDSSYPLNIPNRCHIDFFVFEKDIMKETISWKHERNCDNVNRAEAWVWFTDDISYTISYSIIDLPKPSTVF